MIDLITPIAKLKETLEKVQLNDQNTVIYERLKSIIPILENRVNGVGALVCNPLYLNNINSYLANIQNYVNNDISNPTSGCFNNIPGQIDNIISQLMYIPDANKVTTKQSLNQVIDSYKRQNENVIAQVNSEKKSLENEVLTLKQQVDELKKQINEKETELNSLVENFKQRFESDQNIRNNSFHSKQNRIVQDWDEAGKRYSEQVRATEEEIQKRFDDKYQNLEKQTTEIISELETRRTEINKIYGLIGEVVSCGEYKKYAEEEKNAANILFWVSFGLFCAASIVLIVALIVEMCGKGEFSWWTVLMRLPIALVLLLPAFYTAIEARKRRNQELRLRDFEIKIANIDPYLKNIDFVETERETKCQSIPEGSKTARDLKIELAKEFFSKQEIVDTDNNIVIPKDMIEVLEKIMTFLDRKEKNKCN